ncbi:MAG: hypothetical protein RL490_1834, partial [Pseudomonadota bacterium]
MLLLAVATPVAAARLTGLSAVPGTVTISADGPPAVAHQFALAAPYRLVVDLPAVLPVPLTAPGAGSVTALRTAMFAPGVARLVIELSQPLAITAARNGPGGLALSLKRVTPEEFAAAVKQGRQPLPVLTGGPAADFVLPDSLSGATTPAPPPVVDAPVVAPVAPPSGPKITPAAPVITPETAVAPPPKARAPGVRARSGGKPLVVIDAGHGGKDVGAISVNGGYEKQVTLAIARATAKALERRGKVRVKLTRADDRFIPLG